MKTSIKVEYIDKLQNINVSFNNEVNSLIVTVDHAKELSIALPNKDDLEITVQSLHTTDVNVLRQTLANTQFTQEEIDTIIRITSNCTTLPRVDDTKGLYSFMMVDGNSFTINKEFTSIKMISFEGDNRDSIKIVSRTGAIVLPYLSSEQLKGNIKQRLMQVGLTPDSYDYMIDYMNRILECLNTDIIQPSDNSSVICTGGTCKLNLF